MPRQFSPEEMMEYFHLKMFFQQNVSPFELTFLCLHIGVPSVMLERITYDYPRDVATIMSKVFDVWYPVAFEVGSKDHLTPREILASAFTEIGRNDLFEDLTDNTSTKMFVQMNSILFENVADCISRYFFEGEKL